jgi:superfamily I DNA and RNA helicase
MLFTAMTRAKGWVAVSGIGEPAQICQREVKKALDNFPDLKFVYPSDRERRIMKRDLQEKDIRKQEMERKLDEIMEQMPVDEIERFIKQRSVLKGQAASRKKK